MTMKLPTDLQVMKDLIEELGYKCEVIRRPDGVAFQVETEQGPVHVKEGYGFILASGRIPGVRMQLIGHGDMRFQIVI